MPSYDHKPRMSADEVATRFCEEVGKGYAFAVVNFANPDMVGHTGSIPAVVQAVGILAILVFGLVPAFPWWDSSWHVWEFVDGEHFRDAARTIMWCVAAVTAVSLVDYLRGNREVLRKIDI